jgi:hypothetical protein
MVRILSFAPKLMGISSFKSDLVNVSDGVDLRRDVAPEQSEHEFLGRRSPAERTYALFEVATVPIAAIWCHAVKATLHAPGEKWRDAAKHSSKVSETRVYCQNHADP